MDDKQKYCLQKVQVLGTNIFPREDIDAEQHLEKVEPSQLRKAVLLADVRQHHDERILRLSALFFQVIDSAPQFEFPCALNLRRFFRLYQE